MPKSRYSQAPPAVLGPHFGLRLAVDGVPAIRCCVGSACSCLKSKCSWCSAIGHLVLAIPMIVRLLGLGHLELRFRRNLCRIAAVYMQPFMSFACGGA